MLSDKLKLLRSKAKLTQKEIAEKLKISQPTYLRYEKGSREPNQEMILKIANLFNVSIDYLLSNDNTEFKKQYDALKDIIEPLQNKKLTDDDRKALRSLIENYFNNL